MTLSSRRKFKKLCGKRRFKTAKEAYDSAHFLEARGFPKMRAYKCRHHREVCWHLTTVE